jgi:hypothetical protein
MLNRKQGNAKPQDIVRKSREMLPPIVADEE